MTPPDPIEPPPTCRACSGLARAEPALDGLCDDCDRLRDQAAVALLAVAPLTDKAAWKRADAFVVARAKWRET